MQKYSLIVIYYEHIFGYIWPMIEYSIWKDHLLSKVYVYYWSVGNSVKWNKQSYSINGHEVNNFCLAPWPVSYLEYYPWLCTLPLKDK